MRAVRLWATILATGVLSVATVDSSNLSAGAQTRADPRLELRSYVDRFTGRDPIDCGQQGLGVPAATVGANLQRSVACALDAAKTRKPFWTLKQDQGIDSQVFQGLLGTAEGAIFRFEYDSSPCGGAACPGRFSIERCAKPAAVASGNNVDFSCQR